MKTLETLKTTLENFRPQMIELERVLSSIPAIAPESGGDGESKKCAALEKWLCEAGFDKNQIIHCDPEGPDVLPAL